MTAPILVQGPHEGAYLHQQDFMTAPNLVQGPHEGAYLRRQDFMTNPIRVDGAVGVGAREQLLALGPLVDQHDVALEDHIGTDCPRTLHGELAAAEQVRSAKRDELLENKRIGEGTGGEEGIEGRETAAQRNGEGKGWPGVLLWRLRPSCCLVLWTGASFIRKPCV
eukprot:scaffold16508_cov108-Isochrysis_galbana.AAC.6